MWSHKFFIIYPFSLWVLLINFEAVQSNSAIDKCLKYEAISEVNPSFKEGHQWFAVYLEENSYLPGNTKDCRILVMTFSGPGEFTITLVSFKKPLQSVHTIMNTCQFHEKGNATCTITSSSLPKHISQFKVIASDNYESYSIAMLCGEEQAFVAAFSTIPVASKSTKQKIDDKLKELGLKDSNIKEINQDECFPRYKATL